MGQVLRSEKNVYLFFPYIEIEHLLCAGRVDKEAPECDDTVILASN